MPNNVYVAEELFPTFPGGTVTDDGDGIDTIVHTGEYYHPNGITNAQFGSRMDLGVGEFRGEADQASATRYIYQNGVYQHTITLRVMGLIENADGSAGTDWLNGNRVDNVLRGDPLDTLGANDSIYGQQGNDTLIGMGGSDLLGGGSGNDRLYGDGNPNEPPSNIGYGDDTLFGGEGDDTLVGGPGTNRIWGDEGFDTVQYDGFQPDATTSIRVVMSYDNTIGTLATVYMTDLYDGTNYVIATDIFIGTSVEQFEGTGGDDYLIAYAGNLTPGSYLYGHYGNDMLVGGQSTDRLFGGAGNDTLVAGSGAIADTLTGGTGNDTYDLGATYPAHVIVELNGEGVDSVRIESSGYVLPDYVENLYLTGTGPQSGTGNGQRNLIVGNAANNFLRGEQESDTLEGGAGNDVLDGGDGADTLIGGAGDDVYLAYIGDTIVELEGGGHDRVQTTSAFSLEAFDWVEELNLTGGGPTEGRGNALANLIIGNNNANTLWGFDGNDTLIGSGGADMLIGGAGNDVYVDPLGDTIMELAGGGTADRVESGVTFDLTTAANVEHLTLTGNSASNGTGNASANIIIGNAAGNRLFGLDGDDTLRGGEGADTISGGLGNDRLEGGAGNDIYINPLASEVVEIAGQGFDRVLSEASFSLATLSNVERVELTGSVPGFLRGNSFANQLIGNSGSNTIEGGGGDDALYGFGGRDTIIGGLGRDTIASGLECDTVKWNSVAESTGATRDSVSEFVFSTGGAYERLDFHVVPTAVRQTITTGVLREASFDGDLAIAVNAANLGANQTVLFDPSGGDLNIAGHLYLIVDANGVAGYQAGADYVVQFTSTYGTLSLANFI